MHSRPSGLPGSRWTNEKGDYMKKRILLLLTFILVISCTIITSIFSSSGDNSTRIHKNTNDVTSINTPSPWIFSEPPKMTIDPNKLYFATVIMAKGGQFVIQLYPDKAPITVNNFVFLARNGFYNGTTFYRVIQNFIAQGGDPSGTGSGGPGYIFDDEISEDLKFDKPGVVAMANIGPNTNGSQFFITLNECPYLNGKYTIFGQVISGMDVVMSIKLRDPSTNPTFSGDAILTITITER
jgi:cyclophilin family peptidyl-prolyl cis-trans isomerase